MLENILKTQKVQTLPREQNFYRLRTDYEINNQIDVKPLDLCHIPFEKRNRVGTQRYSIPGFPCLYAGNTLLVSCRELNVDNVKTLQKAKILRLSNNSRLNFIDISPQDLGEKLNQQKSKGLLGNSSKANYDLYCYGLLYPLIAACHCKVNYKDHTNFKVEYIIPQLTLQWYRDFDKLKSISGIRYLSNKIKSKGKINKHYNFVFPVQDKPKRKGHCSQLRHLFNSTFVTHASKTRLNAKSLVGRVNELEIILKKNRFLNCSIFSSPAFELLE